MPIQIRIRPGGVWHRREEGNGHDKTACGELIGSHSSRDYNFDENLCSLCFTAHEIEMGKEERVIREAASESVDDRFDEDGEPTDVTVEPPITDRISMTEIIRSATLDQGKKK